MMGTFLKTIVKFLALFILITLLLIAVPMIKGIFFCSSIYPKVSSLIPVPYSHSVKDVDIIPNYKQPLERTYLNFPHWYTVYSAKEYADTLEHKNPSDFPYFSAIEQYWCSYKTIYQITRQYYPLNAHDHLIILVNGFSFSVDYAWKGVYENTIGRLTEWTVEGSQTPIDQYAAKTAQAYAEFIPYKPWYTFSYKDRLTGLWSDVPYRGPNQIRQWERRVFLSLEYGIKSVYAWLFAKTSQTTTGTAADFVYADITLKPNTQIDTDIINLPNNDGAIIAIPHKQPFTQALSRLIDKGVIFNNIAGNNEILVTAIAPFTFAIKTTAAKLLFEMPILTQPQEKRIAMQVPIENIKLLLTYFNENNIHVEHFYDY